MERQPISREGYDKLREEVRRLEEVDMPAIAERIKSAREEGDLKENGGYHAAREEQGKNEARIKQLAKMLENAKVGEPEVEEGIVSQGMVVKVEFVDFGDAETFLLGSREQNDHIEGIDVYSATSPLGAAVLGQEVGADVRFETPNGKRMKIRIVSAELYRG